MSGGLLTGRLTGRLGSLGFSGRNFCLSNLLCFLETVDDCSLFLVRRKQTGNAAVAALGALQSSLEAARASSRGEGSTDRTLASLDMVGLRYMSGLGLEDKYEKPSGRPGVRGM